MWPLGSLSESNQHPVQPSLSVSEDLFRQLPLSEPINTSIWGCLSPLHKMPMFTYNYSYLPVCFKSSLHYFYIHLIRRTCYMNSCHTVLLREWQAESVHVQHRCNRHRPNFRGNKRHPKTMLKQVLERSWIPAKWPVATSLHSHGLSEALMPVANLSFGFGDFLEFKCFQSTADWAHTCGPDDAEPRDTECQLHNPKKLCLLVIVCLHPKTTSR